MIVSWTVFIFSEQYELVNLICSVVSIVPVAVVAQATIASQTRLLVFLNLTRTACWCLSATSLLVFLSLTLVDKTTAMSSHSTDLSIINKTSVKFASWVARVTFGHTHQYTYTAKRTGVNVAVHRFECR